MSIPKEQLKLIPFYLFYIILTLTVSDNPFFWDTVQLASKHAHWFYNNDFKSFYLPQDIDSGHPPLFGMYIAACWKVFGRSLWVSHLAMLPFLLGIVFQAYRLISYFIDKNFIYLVLLFFLADPTLLAQSVLVSPDIVLVFLFLYCLNSLLREKHVYLTLASIPLALISMRGMMHVAILGCFFLAIQLLEARKFQLSFLYKGFILFSPSINIAAFWLWLHYAHTGWVGYHSASPWSESFEAVNLMGFLRNIGILGWRLIDFGRVFIWCAAIPVIVLILKNKSIERKALILLVLFTIALVVLVPNMLSHANLLGHRYLLALYLIFGLFVVYSLQIYWRKNFQWIVSFLILGLATGNFWVYKDGIAQGWDASLAHYPYYSLRSKMNQYIKESNIDRAKIGTAFPNASSTHFIDLSAEDWQLAEKDLKNNSYVFYSNIYNGFSDEDLEELKTWKEVKRFESLNIKVVLYKNKAIE